jgi:hypothetical protein
MLSMLGFYPFIQIFLQVFLFDILMILFLLFNHILKAQALKFFLQYFIIDFSFISALSYLQLEKFL